MTANLPVTFLAAPDLSAAEFQHVLKTSGLAARRPADDLGRLDKMLKNADLIVAARRGDEFVGVARTVTDFSYCAYLSDLAVAKDLQGEGIGKALIAETRKRLGPSVTLILVAAPGVGPFYEKIGMDRIADAFKFSSTA